MRRKNGKAVKILAVAAVVLILAAAVFAVKNHEAEEHYRAAVSLMESGEYEAAATALEALKGYRDSAELTERCRTAILDDEYAEAERLMENGDYEAAVAALEALKGYRDAEELTERCRTAILESGYAEAEGLMESGEYEAAIAAFGRLNGYRDAEAQILRCKAMQEAEKVTVGQIVSFGHFEQDNDAANGKEEIQWIVLAKEGFRIFVISRDALYARGYNDVNEAVTWETCTLRAWLNGEFLEEAFSDEERAQIPTVNVPPAESPKYHTDPGNATEDKLFLISIADLDEYFPTDSDRECKPTAYAIANGAEAKEVNGNCWWWLRSPGINNSCAARVNCYGSLRNAGPPVSSYYSCVRPAMWIDLVP